MTIEQARKILKLTPNEASDEMILKIIELTRELVKLFLQSQSIYNQNRKAP